MNGLHRNLSQSVAPHWFGPLHVDLINRHPLVWCSSPCNLSCSSPKTRLSNCTRCLPPQLSYWYHRIRSTHRHWKSAPVLVAWLLCEQLRSAFQLARSLRLVHYLRQPTGACRLENARHLLLNRCDCFLKLMISSLSIALCMMLWYVFSFLLHLRHNPVLLSQLPPL